MIPVIVVTVGVLFWVGCGWVFLLYDVKKRHQGSVRKAVVAERRAELIQELAQVQDDAICNRDPDMVALTNAMMREGTKDSDSDVSSWQITKYVLWCLFVDALFGPATWIFAFDD